MKLATAPIPPPVRGFRFAGVHAGLKSRARRDFALIVADRPAVCAAAFTRNRAAAAPVLVAREHAKQGEIQAIMVNSGSANAGTGEKGRKFAEWSCRELGARLSIDPSLVLPCSTGIIGVELERVAFARAVSLGVDALSRKAFGAAARAIMTSDAFPKWAHRTLKVGSRQVAVAGMAKGAGMICPNMATMLSFVLTDARLGKNAARAMLDTALASTFNRISVDGDTSTNDTLVLLASGESGAPAIDGPGDAGYATVAEAVHKVMDELSRMIVRDGEGAKHVVDIVVQGASDDATAERIARSIAGSVLVRCAAAGADPNWGRILCAIGNSGVDVDPGAIAFDMGDVALVRSGVVVSKQAAKAARQVMRRETYRMLVRVGQGKGCATVVTSDLTEAYVRFNSAYSS
jgi:glutamate N-acetyltransferase/amino-acid N-acetyltransferase